MASLLPEMDLLNMNEVQPNSSGANAPQTRKPVPSKKVRQGKKESHKKHLNQKTVENKIKPRLDAKRHFPEEDLAALLEECRRTAMQQPVREIEVKVETPALRELCVQTVDYLHTVGKVAPGVDDVDNLEKVVKAQALTKIAIARRSNGKIVDVGEADYTSRIEKRFTVLPKIANIYLENIGQFECEGQVFVPKRLRPLRFSNLARGRYMTSMTRNSPEGVREVAIVTVEDNMAANYVTNGLFTGDPFTLVTNGHGSISWERIDSVGDFHALCVWYENFISKCGRKASGLLQNVVYTKGEGTVAQLVGSRDDPQTMRREIWCNRKIDQNTLQIGGLFGYGYLSSDKYHDEDIAVIHDGMDVEGMYQRIQRCQRL